jgi:preprotein translocase subunit YajC
LNTPALLADVKEIARLAQITKDDRIARDAGIIDGIKSYDTKYKESYDGTDSFGCSLNQSSNVKDPTLLLLLMFALGYIFIPRKQRAV